MAAEAKARAAAEKAKAAKVEEAEGKAEDRAAPRRRRMWSASLEQQRQRENADALASVADETRVPCPMGERTGNRHDMEWKHTGDRLVCDLEFRSTSHQVCLNIVEAGVARCECPCTPREAFAGLDKPPGIVLCMECAREQAVEYSEDEEGGE